MFKRREKGFSMVELTAVMTISSLLAAGAAIVYDAHVKDSEEFNHISNAQTLAEATEAVVVQKNIGPALNDTVSFTLADIYSTEKLQPIVDPSDPGQGFYHDTNSTITVENVSEGGRTFFKFFVTLEAATGNYKYIYEDDGDLSDSTDAVLLTRESVKIPRRDAAGWQ